jgi:hypothetical protein
LAGGAGVAAHPAARRVGEQRYPNTSLWGSKGRTLLAGLQGARSLPTAARAGQLHFAEDTGWAAPARRTGDRHPSTREYVAWPQAGPLCRSVRDE